MDQAAATRELHLSDLGPFWNRPEEWSLYQPLLGKTMLELGGKWNNPHTYKSFFQHLGYEHVSVDWNGDHGALKLDLQQPLNLGTFDMVTNIGTSEHVDEQTGVWRNIVEVCHAGSVLISTTPYPDGADWYWHAEHFPTEEFYRALARLNCFTIERMYVAFEAPRRMWFVRMVRTQVCEHFQMPHPNTIYHNVIRPR